MMLRFGVFATAGVFLLAFIGAVVDVNNDGGGDKVYAN